MRRVITALASWSTPLLVAIVMVAQLLGAPATALTQTLAGGGGHSVVVKPDGTVWTFGQNNVGQIGDNTQTTRRTPTQVAGVSNIVAVAAGAMHTLALQSDGTLWAWGSNSYGELGDGTPTSRTTPVAVGLTSVVAIAAGENHSLALRSNGEVYAWGRNGNGQLATGNTSPSSTPLLIVTDGAGIGAGRSHTLVVKTNGSVWAAGLNGHGQLGDGTTTPRNTLVQMSGVSGATAARGGERHSVILLSNGTAKAVGYNDEGELGDGTTQGKTTAVTVSGLTNITSVAVGASHTLARRSDGTVWAWGWNNQGRLGDGTTASHRSVPTLVSSLSAIDQIGAGGAHSLAVDTSGVVFTWGVNIHSQLGDGTTIARPLPVSISGPNYDWKVATPTLSEPSGTYHTDRTVVVNVETAGATIHYTQNGTEPTEADLTVAAGGSVLVSSSQTLKAKAWKAGMPPSSTVGAVYTMKVGTPSYAPNGALRTAPVTVTVTTVTPGAALRYTTDGSTPTASSPLYTGPLTLSTYTPLRVMGFKPDWSPSDMQDSNYRFNYGTATAPSIGPAGGTFESSVTVTMTAQAGATIRFRTDGGTPTDTSTAYAGPIVVESTSTVKAKTFHPDYITSSESSAAYTISVAAPTFSPSAGTYAAGQSIVVTSPTPGTTMRYTIHGAEPTTSDPIIASGGALVVGNYTLKVRAWKTGATTSPITSATYSVSGTPVPLLVAGGDQSFGLPGDGVVWGWGVNSNGQLGIGTSAGPQLLPVMAQGLTGIVAVEAGTYQTLALKSDGTVFHFGFGQVLPSIAGAFTASAVAVGEDHNLVLKTDGTLLSSGSNNFGQIGDGTNQDRPALTAVSGLTDVVAVAAGQWFSVAAKADGTVWSWGQNQQGRLGDGTTTNRWNPVQIGAFASPPVSIALGSGHALIRFSDGSVKGWGHNQLGALGDGSTTNRTTPIDIVGVSDVTAIAAGGFHSLFLRSDGTVWATGANSYGAIGDGTTVQSLVPKQVAGLANIVGIAAGAYHSLALASDGTVYAWGRNNSGQFGYGTTANALTPMPISGPGLAWRACTPQIALASGLYYASQQPTVTCADPSAVLHYSLSGTDPTEADPTVSGATVAVDQSLTLKISAWKAGSPTSVVSARTYELKAVTPTMSPGSGSYATSQSVGISTTTPSAAIVYTVDGTEPHETSANYSAPPLCQRA